MDNPNLWLRLDLANGHHIGPGKIALLEAIRAKGSISAAARQLGMSYRRAWLLVEQINEALREPAVTAATGGQHGGGAGHDVTRNALFVRYAPSRPQPLPLRQATRIRASSDGSLFARNRPPAYPIQSRRAE